MASTSAIEWTDATWQPVTGCSVVSPGCANCYAMRLAGTRLKHHPSRANLTTMTKSGPVWNGAVRFNEQWLTQPLGWKKPRRIFVCAHGDLFHEGVPDEWIDRVFAVMALTPQHTYQVLTKRSARMREYFEVRELGRDGVERGRADLVFEVVEETYGRQWYDRKEAAKQPDNWPLPNVWLGVSTERQKEADERIPDLLATPAAIRFISAEPLLGPIDMTALSLPGVTSKFDALCHGATYSMVDGRRFYHIGQQPTLDQVIVGGENGERPMHPAWARSLRDQCANAGVAFFFKQWGTWMPTSGVDVYCNGPDKNKRRYPKSGGVAMLADGRICLHDFTVAQHAERMRTGIAGDTRAVEVDRTALADFYDSIKDEHRAKDNPLGLQWMYAVGKKAAGRLLDGVTHDAMPEAASL